MPEKRRCYEFTFLEETTITESAGTDAYDLTEFHEVNVWMKVGLIDHPTPPNPPNYIGWKLQVSDNNDDWADHTSFTNATTANSIKLGKITGNFGRFCRIYYTLCGWAGASVEITGIAKT